MRLQLIAPDVPTELRQPVQVPARPMVTLADVGLVLTDHVQALDRANGQIAAIDTILTTAEQEIEGEKHAAE